MTFSGRTDAELMAALVGGDEDALGALYDRHADAVFRVAFRLLGDRVQAEDVLQETMLALWNRAETYDSSVASLAAWLLTIARNRAVDRLRARARRPASMPMSIALGPEPDDTALDRLVGSGALVGAATSRPDPAAAAEATWLAGAVRDALAAMPDPERQALELAYYHDLSQSEIAARLGWPLGTVKTRTRRALARLRVTLAEVLGPDAGLRIVPSMSTVEAYGAFTGRGPDGSS
ncbi:MAG: sigma-70 family RNA polymerase sigma factor [Candidatus Limnocylindrales bacterium]